MSASVPIWLPANEYVDKIDQNGHGSNLVTETVFEPKSILLIMNADLTRKLCESKIRVFLGRNG